VVENETLHSVGERVAKSKDACDGDALLAFPDGIKGQVTLPSRVASFLS